MRLDFTSSTDSPRRTSGIPWPCVFVQMTSITCRTPSSGLQDSPLKWWFHISHWVSEIYGTISSVTLTNFNYCGSVDPCMTRLLVDISAIIQAAPQDQKVDHSSYHQADPLEACTTAYLVACHLLALSACTTPKSESFRHPLFVIKTFAAFMFGAVFCCNPWRISQQEAACFLNRMCY